MGLLLSLDVGLLCVDVVFLVLVCCRFGGGVSCVEVWVRDFMFLCCLIILWLWVWCSCFRSLVYVLFRVVYVLLVVVLVCIIGFLLM